MTVLGIETATTICAAALLRDGTTVHEASLDSENVHAERLLGQIDEVLGRGGIPVRALDAVAVSIGPGSFTGLRIGLSVAKGLAYAASLSVIGVPTLEALARHAAAADPAAKEEFVLAALDARRDEVYCQLFWRAQDDLTPAWDAAAMTVGELRELIADRDVLVAGNAVRKVIGTERTYLPRAREASAHASRCSAAAVAALGTRMFRAGMKHDPAALEPLYIKEFFLKSR